MTSVLMTTDTVGGVWTYALELADAMAPTGVEVVLATMGRPMNRQQRREVSGSAVAEVHESTFALEWMDDPWVEVELAGEWLVALEHETEPDVVHLNGFVHATLPWRAPALVVAHSCVVTWWEAVHHQRAPAQWDQYRSRVGAGLAAADAVVAPSQAMADALDRCYGPTGAVVLANCRRSDWVREVPKEQLVLSAGRLWDQAKNLAMVHRVAPRLSWAVMIAGATRGPGAGADGDEAATSGEWAARSSTLLGPLPFAELAPWLLRASVFVLPARYEPFGLAALEAGLAGCALVLGDIPSLRQVWGDAALFVDPSDEDGLVSALRRLCDDPDFLVDMASRARRRAGEFTPERCAAGYLALYDRLRVKAGGVA